MSILFPRRLVPFVLLILCFLFIVGCGDKEKPSATDSPENSSIVTESPGIPDYYVQAPLTGQMVDPAVLERRPVAVMVENAPAARPQSGLQKADVVYEVLAEGGITRFLALYYSQDCSNVGPVRSARPYYIERALEYNAIYAHCGGSEDAKSLLKALRMPDLDEIGIARRGKAFWRVKSRRAPHNLYADTSRLRQVALDKGYKAQVDVPAFSYLAEEETPSGGTAAEKITVNYPRSYSVVSYRYDPNDKCYLRSEGGMAHKDAVTGQQLKASNIIVQYTNTKVVDKEGRLQVDMVGSGRSVLYMDGKAFEGSWQKNSADAWTVFMDANGNEFKLRPGQTWIEVVPLKTKVKVENQGGSK